MQSAFGQHDIDQLAHGVFDLLSGQYAYTVGMLVYIEVNTRKMLHSALVVFCFESEVSLDIDEYL